MKRRMFTAGAVFWVARVADLPPPSLCARADLLKRMLTMRSSGWFGWWFCWMHRRGRVSQRVMTLTNDFFFTALRRLPLLVVAFSQ